MCVCVCVCVCVSVCLSVKHIQLYTCIAQAAKCSSTSTNFWGLPSGVLGDFGIGSSALWSLPSNTGAERARSVASALPASVTPARRGERRKWTGEAGESVLTHILESQCSSIFGIHKFNGKSAFENLCPDGAGEFTAPAVSTRVYVLLWSPVLKL